MLSQKNVLTLACSLALLIAASFYILFCTAGNGIPASPEPDQTIYLQYARNIAQGHPYVFCAGDAPSTGSTTHLYPFVLAACHKLGASGDALFTASFILNSLFYLCIALLGWLIAKKIYPTAATLLLFTILLSGHTVAAVFSQTDIGFFAVLALGAVGATVYEKKWLMLGMIILCAITRPEGAIFSMAYLLTGGASLVLKTKFEDAPGSRNQAKWFLVCAVAGLLAYSFTLGINKLLTGHTQFMSVANKGYFNMYPFFGAAEHTLRDLLDMLKGFLFGMIPTGRQFYHVPLIGGLIGISGILLYPRENKKIRLTEFWLLLSAGAVFLSVASSQWQGLSNDRYLGWLFPLWTLYILIGVFEIGKRINIRYFIPICLTLLIGFQFVSMAYIFSQKYSMTTQLNRQKVFAQQLDAELPPAATLGSASGGSGILYYMPNRKLYNLQGILSPDFFDADFSNDPARTIDRLKHRPELQFDYWFATTKKSEVGSWAQPFIGPVVLMDNDSAVGDDRAWTVYSAKWSDLMGGNSPVLMENKLKDYLLIDSMDVGYCPDEQEHDYHANLRLKNTRLSLSVKHAKLGERDYSEVGRIILGSESFTIQNVTPKKSVRMILRTSRSASGDCYSGRQISAIKNFELNDTVELEIWINGMEVANPLVAIGKDGFQEIALDIPAKFVPDTELNVEIAGDHISYAYWFFQ